MKKKTMIILLILTVIILIIGIILLILNNNKSKRSIEIIDATFSKCNPPKEFFYEDKDNKYYYPCVKSTSIFVKFPNGNKMLINDALRDGKVNINELLKAGLEVITEKK